MTSRVSMFSAFRIGPAASGRRLCDIDSVLFKVTESRVKELKCSDTTKIYPTGVLYNLDFKSIFHKNRKSMILYIHVPVIA